ncbi:hypothetical protein [Bacteroides hominis]|uniref:hypothetical protein n=1 Tax=Bacteroides hominis TaxID=2763023 RepID=UPI003D6D54C4
MMDTAFGTADYDWRADARDSAMTPNTGDLLGLLAEFPDKEIGRMIDSPGNALLY